MAKVETLSTPHELDRDPKVRGLLKKMEAHWEATDDIQSMITNEINMAQTKQLREYLLRMYQNFLYQKIDRAVCDMGYSFFPATFVRGAELRQSIASVMPEKTLLENLGDNSDESTQSA